MPALAWAYANPAAVGAIDGSSWPTHKPRVFTYMTSSGRLLVPFLFTICSPEVNINGVGGRVLPSAG
jgi:hypothetical protein